MEGSETGDLANWTIPGKRAKEMGDAMDRVAGLNRVLVLMEHTAQDGKPKILDACTLPLTGKSVVNRVITGLAVLDVTNEGFVVREPAPDVAEENVVERPVATVPFEFENGPSR